jgi:hypothetical protein
MNRGAMHQGKSHAARERERTSQTASRTSDLNLSDTDYKASRFKSLQKGAVMGKIRKRNHAELS